MPFVSRQRPYPGFDLYFVLLCCFLGVLWLAGGASRADVLGQIVVRGTAVAALLATLMVGSRTNLRSLRPIILILLSALTIILLQLIPLPPTVWLSMPGRESLVIGETGIWRPLAIAPGAAINAAMSLLVPLTVLYLTAGLSERARGWLPGILLGFIAASMMVGLLQFAGVEFDNPFINDTRGEVRGMFANRNHFAVGLALGLLLVPVWAFLPTRRAGWRAPAAFGLVLLFALAILATGSRAGMIAGAMALVFGIAFAWRYIRGEFSSAPRWVFPALLLGMAIVVGGLVILSVAADRAVSVDRALTVDIRQDMRVRALPTVLTMVQTYFPMGAGFGGFDRNFMIYEPFNLLKSTYFNHAHSDFLEVVIDAGGAGVALLVAIAGWWAWASIRAWRERAPGARLARCGSAMLLIVAAASLFDYPARTPTMMAIMVIAAVWLCDIRVRRTG